MTTIVGPSSDTFVCPGLEGLGNKTERVGFFRDLAKRSTHCTKCTNLERCGRDDSETGDLPEESSKPAVLTEDKEDSTFCPAMNVLYLKKNVSTPYVRKERCIKVSAYWEFNERSCRSDECESPWCLCSICVSQVPEGQEKIFLDNEKLAELCRVEPGTKLCFLHNREPGAVQDFSKYIKKEVRKKQKKEGEKMDKKWKEINREEKISAVTKLGYKEAMEEFGISDATFYTWRKKAGLIQTTAKDKPVLADKPPVGKSKKTLGDKRKIGMTWAAKEEIGHKIDTMLLAKIDPQEIEKELDVHISTVHNHRKALVKAGKLKEESKIGKKVKKEKRGTKKGREKLFEITAKQQLTRKAIDAGQLLFEENDINDFLELVKSKIGATERITIMRDKTTGAILGTVIRTENTVITIKERDTESE